jgi:hypothetical protein
MASLAQLPELIGFFSYSREDDEDSSGALSALRDRIQRELRGQLGRSKSTFRLWQDKEAIAPGKLWEDEIKTAAGQAVFFIPIITPTVIRSHYCKFELDSFIARETKLGRDDLVFPILYINVPELDDSAQRQNDPVLAIVAKRQYLDWREFRHRDIQSMDVKEQIERFCAHVCAALRRPWISPEEEREAAARQAEEERRRVQAAAERREAATKKAIAGAEAAVAAALQDEHDAQTKKNAEARDQNEAAARAEQERRAAAERRLATERRLREEADAKRLATKPSPQPTPTTPWAGRLSARAYSMAALAGLVGLLALLALAAALKF